jgi:hypothetical protein
MNGYAGRSPLRSRKPEENMLKGCVQNSKRECAALVVGMAAFTGQISQSVPQYRKWCLIDGPSPNSLFAFPMRITGSRRIGKALVLPPKKALTST